MTKFAETQAFGAIAYGALGLSAVAVAISGLIWPVLLLGLPCNLLCRHRNPSDCDIRRTAAAVPAADCAPGNRFRRSHHLLAFG